MTLQWKAPGLYHPPTTLYHHIAWHSQKPQKRQLRPDHDRMPSRLLYRGRDISFHILLTYESSQGFHSREYCTSSGKQSVRGSRGVVCLILPYMSTHTDRSDQLLSRIPYDGSVPSIQILLAYGRSQKCTSCGKQSAKESRGVLCLILSYLSTHIDLDLSRYTRNSNGLSGLWNRREIYHRPRHNQDTMFL